MDLQRGEALLCLTRDPIALAGPCGRLGFAEALRMSASENGTWLFISFAGVECPPSPSSGPRGVASSTPGGRHGSAKSPSVKNGLYCALFMRSA
jgi:hypothetical protein